MRVGVVAVALLVAVCVAVLVPNHPAGRDPAEDTGVFLYAAQRLLDGGAPYRDIWDHKPPGVYFVDAVGLAIGGREGLWLIQLAFLVAAALAGYRALQRQFGDLPALLGSLAWLVALPRLFLEYGQTNFVEFFGLPLQLGALLLLRDAHMPTNGRAIAIGSLGGAAVLFKPTLGAIWIAIGIVMLLRRPRAAVVPLAAMAVGAAVPILAALTWAASSGILGEMLDQALAYNRAYAAYSPASDRLDAVLEGLRLTLPSGLALISVGAWTFAIVTRRWDEPLVAVAIVAFPIEMVFAALGRAYHYYFIPWLPAMAVLTAFAVRELRIRASGRNAHVALAVATILMCAYPALLVTRLALMTDARRLTAVASYVAANSGPEDTVFIWGAHAEVLFLADRLSATRYVNQYGPLYTRGYTTAARVDELLRDLERSRPVLIIDAAIESYVTPPLDSRALNAWVSPDPQYAPLPELERVVAFIEASYVRAGTEPTTGWPVWRLREQVPR